jgi:ParB family chromosome partitioning protein
VLSVIPIDKIEVGRRLRDISESAVASLTASIADIGLLNPITVYPRQIIRGGVSVDGFGLVAGLHRKTACERLGLAEIEAHVLDLSELERQIAECDENLCAFQLSPSDRARFTKRRKEAYEALHPETKHGSNQHTRGVDNLSTPSYADDQAEKTGVDARTIRRDAERGEKVAGEALDLIKGTPLDTGVFLDELKHVEQPEQVKTVRQRLAEIRDAQKPRPTAAQANKIKLDADIRERAAKSCAELLAEYLPPEAWDHFKSNLAVTTAKDLLTEFTNITGQSVADKAGWAA